MTLIIIVAPTSDLDCDHAPEMYSEALTRFVHAIFAAMTARFRAVGDYDTRKHRFRRRTNGGAIPLGLPA
ncbi:hypothetical protein [Pandoraea cepalis]|uniref:hypothetical protein n=1 Tax=Pandoraea cepalis TaxID=2508294 RepID=UPI001241637D|nr:hypothetical protein [Pandoraea cepalis]